MHLFIVPFEGETRIAYASEDWSIAQLKRLLAGMFNYNPLIQRLYFRRRLLDRDQLTLKECGILPGCTLKFYIAAFS
jgi:hypothetical protein